MSQKCFPQSRSDEVGAEENDSCLCDPGSFGPCGGKVIPSPTACQILTYYQGLRDKGSQAGPGGENRPHDPFHALENAFLKVSLEENYILYTDTSLLYLVGLNLARVEQKVGLRINVLFCSNSKTKMDVDEAALTREQGIDLGFE